MSGLAPTVEELRSDRNHGASWMARRAVETLLEVSEQPFDTSDALLEALIGAGRQLSESRPGVGAIAGASGRVLAAASAHRHLDVDELRKLIGEEGNGILDGRVRAAASIAIQLQERLKDSVVLTHSASATVREALVHTPPARAICTVSEPVGEGRAFAEDLRGEGLERRPRRGRRRTGRARRRDALPDRCGHGLPRRDAQQQDRDDGDCGGRCRTQRPDRRRLRDHQAGSDRGSVRARAERGRASAVRAHAARAAERDRHRGRARRRPTASARSSTARPSCARATRCSCRRTHSRQCGSPFWAFVAAPRDGLHGPQHLEDEGERRQSSTSLEISVTPGGEAPTKIWTLRCPEGGTLPDAAEACSKLESLDDPFAPVPKDVACTQIYGGPQEADVRGDVPRPPRRGALQPRQRLRDRALGQGRVPLPRRLRCLCA